MRTTFQASSNQSGNFVTQRFSQRIIYYRISVYRISDDLAIVNGGNVPSVERTEREIFGTTIFSKNDLVPNTNAYAQIKRVRNSLSKSHF